MFSSLPFHLWWVKPTIPGHLKCTLAFCLKVPFSLFLFSFISILNYFCLLVASLSNHPLSHSLFSLVPALKSKARPAQILPWLDLPPPSPASSCRSLTLLSSLPGSPSPSILLKTPTFQRAGTLHLCLQKFSLSIWPTF